MYSTIKDSVQYVNEIKKFPNSECNTKSYKTISYASDMHMHNIVYSMYIHKCKAKPRRLSKC